MDIVFGLGLVVFYWVQGNRQMRRGVGCEQERTASLSTRFAPFLFDERISQLLPGVQLQ